MLRGVRCAAAWQARARPRNGARASEHGRIPRSRHPSTIDPPQALTRSPGPSDSLRPALNQAHQADRQTRSRSRVRLCRAVLRKLARRRTRRPPATRAQTLLRRRPAALQPLQTRAAALQRLQTATARPRSSSSAAAMTAPTCTRRAPPSRPRRVWCRTCRGKRRDCSQA